jgi:hypothetical protein
MEPFSKFLLSARLFLGLAPFFADPVEGTPVLAPPPIAARNNSVRYICEQETGLADTVVKTFTLGWSQAEQSKKGTARWLFIQANKVNGETFHIWLLTEGYPSDSLLAASKHIGRFILQEGSSTPKEFRHRITREAVLPALGGWRYLLPRSSDDSGSFEPGAEFPKRADYLGLHYRLLTVDKFVVEPVPPEALGVELQPDLLVGVPSNTRQEDETHRYDGSDYKLQRLTLADFKEMAAAGINCVRVDAEQRGWIEDLGLFYWGVGGKEVSYPECLYDSRYLGPTLFLDEPAVHTRDYVIRPKLAKDPAFRKDLTIPVMIKAFRETFAHAWQEGVSTSLLQGLGARPDVMLGNMSFRQENLFSWETMVSTAAYQLSQDPRVPAAMVFEPPGRVGTLKTLPEFDMSYGCQIPIDDPKNLTDIIYGFLRGAARLTGKQWGTSIYGAVDRTDSPWFLTRAYELGATRFFFWDNAGLACVPYHECLSLAHQLKISAENRPERDLEKLRRAAEVVILLPPGYNLGHVHLGRGSLWGLGELNLERTNAFGIKYRDVMGNFFTEIERCLRMGVAFDLLWDLPNLQPSAYREVVRIREDGKIESLESERHSQWDRARTPVRPPGVPPILEVVLSTRDGQAPLQVSARAQVTETTAPIYYTLGADTNGVYHNAFIGWELYGPGEEDYRVLMAPGLKPRAAINGTRSEIRLDFELDRPGQYRLRVATADKAGRTAISWTPITVTK